jgi:multiple sugar transport system substrate-binding protein
MQRRNPHQAARTGTGLSRRDFLRASSLAALGAPALAACGGTPGGDSQALRFWSITPFVDAVQELMPKTVAAVAQKMGITVELEMIPNEQRAARYQTAVESEQLPDVFMLEELQIPQMSGIGALSGTITEVYDRVGAEHGGWLDSAAEMASVGENVVSVPFVLQPYMLYYRQDLFEQAGFSVPISGDLDELVRACRAVHDPAGGVAAFAAPMSDADHGGHIDVVNWLFGGGWQGPDGKMRINTPENLAALKWYTGLYTTEKVVPADATTYTPVSNNTAYLNGSTALICNTGSVMTSLRDEKPDILEKTVVGPWPKSPTGSGPAMSAGGAGLMIAETSNKKDMAAEFIAELFKEQHLMPILQAWGAEGFPTLQRYSEAPAVKENPRLAQITEGILPVAHSVFWPGEATPAYSAVFAEDAGNVGRVLTPVCLGQMSPEDALAGLQEVAERAEERFSS